MKYFEYDLTYGFFEGKVRHGFVQYENKREKSKGIYINRKLYELEKQEKEKINPSSVEANSHLNEF